MKIIQILKLSLFLSTLLFLASCSNSQKLNIASHVWPGYEFMFLARDLGLLNQDMIYLHETQSASETLELLKEGKVDGGALTFDEVIRARNDGTDLVVVLVFDISAGADVILAKPSIKKLGDLKDKKIAVEVGAVGSIMLDQALKKANLTEQDVKVVEASIDQHEKVWKEEIVDAVITYEPVSSKIINLDGQQIFSSQEAPNLIVDVLAIRPSALKNRNAIKHLIETHFKAKTHFDTNHQDSLYRMAPRMEVQPHEVDHMFKGLYLPDYQNNLRLLSGKKPELLISADLISGILDINFAENQNTEINQIIDDRFLLSLD